MPEPIDNPLRYQPTQRELEEASSPEEAREMIRRASLPIVDSRAHKSDGFVHNPPIDSMAIMHVLEQIKMEMRTLASEVALLASEVANVRRQMAPTPPVRYYNT